jgi:hypothetical protein
MNWGCQKKRALSNNVSSCQIPKRWLHTYFLCGMLAYNHQSIDLQMSSLDKKNIISALE